MYKSVRSVSIRRFVTLFIYITGGIQDVNPPHLPSEASCKAGQMHCALQWLSSTLSGGRGSRCVIHMLPCIFLFIAGEVQLRANQRYVVCR